MSYKFLKRLQDAREGVAMVEFGLVAPILLLMILGGLEVVNYALSHMRISQMAMTVADNAGRVPTSIDEANIYEVFAGAQVIGEPLEFKQNGRLILSSVQLNNGKGNKKGQMINWQRCWGDLAVAPAYGKQNKGRNDNSLKDGVGKPGKRIGALKGTAVMFVEVTYDYQPLVAGDWIPTQQIKYESAFNVRGRQNLNITNAQSLAVNDCT
ncbi:TadE/TadG family type IV pilus assembly protein [Erythrobacter sp. HA6-11]